MIELSTVEIETGRYVKRFEFWNPSTWAIPALYWDTFSQEQRIHAICRQLGKVVAYADYLGVNVDDIAARLKAIEDGELDEIITAAIEQWFEEHEPEITAALAALNEALPIDEFDAENTVKSAIDAVTERIEPIEEKIPSYDYLDEIYKQIPIILPEWEKVGELSLPENHYFNAFTFWGNNVYATSATIATREDAYISKFTFPDFQFVSETLVDSKTVSGYDCYYNSINVMDDKLLVMPYLGQAIIKLLDPNDFTVLASGNVDNIGMSGVVATSNNTLIYNPALTSNYAMAKATESGRFVKCASFKGVDLSKHLRADMDVVPNTLMFIHANSGQNGQRGFLCVFNTAGYHIADIIAPDDEELQGVFIKEGYVYVLFAFGNVYRCPVPAVITSDMNGVNSHGVNCSNLRISGFFAPVLENDALPNVPYQVETAFAREPGCNLLDGFNVRYGNVSERRSVPSAAANPVYWFDNYQNTLSATPNKRLIYTFSTTTGVFTLTRICDLAAQTFTVINSHDDYVANASAIANYGTIRFLNFGTYEAGAQSGFQIGPSGLFKLPE